jgi:hypothetical protein
MDTDGIVIVDGPLGLNMAKPLEFLKQSPEFIDASKRLVMGGFGALAHPTSFHHPDVRFMRKIIYDRVTPFLREWFPSKKVAIMFDRIAQRREGDSISGETYHRDICDQKRPEDIILGGWINLDTDQDHYFHCVPGTHNDETDAKGFSKLKDQKEYKNLEKIYKISPGQIIIFHQNLVHRIKPGKIKKYSERMYLGWLVTDLDTPVIDYTECIQNQSPPKIPSGQDPPIYAKMHMVCHKQKVRDFFENVVEQLRDMRFQIGLKQANLPLWRPYNQDDIDIFIPI